MMKQFLKDSAVFLTMATMGYVMLVIVWAHFVPFGFLKKNMIYPIGGKGFTHSRMLEADTTQNIDVLFLGSPHAFRGFDPRIFEKAGFRSFNLGSPSQTPFQTKLLLEKYLDQLNPAYVVFEVYPVTFQNDGVESSLDLMANMEGLGNSLTMVRAVPHVRTVNALIYDGFREQLNLNQGFEEGLKAGQDTYVPQGFVESRVQSNQSPITDKIRQSWASDTWQIRDWQQQEFEQIRQMLEARNIELILVQMPVTRAAFELYKNNDFVDSLFTSQGAYYNLNRTLEMDDDMDFIDYHHLNQSGVVKANTVLVGLLNDRRALENSHG